ncbi:MAG: uracil-DNA glycosylase [Burkholderiaceae bacterium]
MSLGLDARQRAMLEEMGVRVWWPEAEPAAPLCAEPVPLPASPASPTAPDFIAAPAQPVRAVDPKLLENRPQLQPLPAGLATMDWPALRSAVAGCQACALCAGRKNAVPGAGGAPADWLIVGDAPDENEDLQGQPFVGPAGQLLDNMLKALKLDRQQVYLSHALKCRPPANRSPSPDEVAQCEPYLRRQVELLRPRIILAMGRFAVQSLLQTTEPLGKLRGRVHRYHGVPVVVSYPPAYLLRSGADKAKAWADLCLAQDVLKPAA